MEQNNEKKYIVGSILCGLLTAFGIVASVISLIGGGSNGITFFMDCTQVFLFVAIFYYALIGYKIPHGNMLKYIMLIRAAFCLVVVYSLTKAGITWPAIVVVIQISLSCYIAGRLNKVKENTILIIIVAFCIIIHFVLGFTSGMATIGAANGLIVWLDICVAYFLRYKQHREAGLEDAPKSK